MRDFSLDKKRLREVCLITYQAYLDRRGIFKEIIDSFLPQQNLPQDLENSPKTKKPREELKAAKFLFHMALMERRAQSRTHIKNALKTWSFPSKRWIFDQEEVAKKDYEKIKIIMKKDFQYTLDDFPLKLQSNALLLKEKYNSDPRNLIKNLTVEESRKRLMEFEGVGTGIANLFIIYMTDRDIANPLDPENLRVKVDIHKSRIPVNTNSVYSNQSHIRRDLLVEPLEILYTQICQEEGIPLGTLDSLVWTIGSEVCVKRNYETCLNKCPLSRTLCQAYTPEDPRTGKFILEENAKRPDPRSHVNQGHFDFYFEE